VDACTGVWRQSCSRSVARTLFSCRCAGGMTAEQEHEDSRLVAIHRLVAVRRFAQGDAEPCQLLEGLFIGARVAPAPGAAHWPLGGCCAVQFSASRPLQHHLQPQTVPGWMSWGVLLTESFPAAWLYCSAQRRVPAAAHLLHSCCWVAAARAW